MNKQEERESGVLGFITTSSGQAFVSRHNLKTAFKLMNRKSKIIDLLVFMLVKICIYMIGVTKYCITDTLCHTSWHMQ